jgi:ABC-2 type transport system permease protein
VSGALVGHAFRQVWRGAAVWALVFGGTAVASATAYTRTFPSAASRHQLAATTGQDTGLAVLLGPVSGIGTVGGYTVYKGFLMLTTIGAVWGVLAATRLLRGEEDAGRWQLLLSGATTPGRATAATLAALGAAVGVVLAGSTGLLLLVVRNPDLDLTVAGTLAYGASTALVPAVFVGVGAVCSQLGRSRRAANGLALSILGATFLVRMVADAEHRTSWLLWLTPFGWSERVRPYREDDLRPVALAAVATAALAALACVLATRRDTGGGLLATRDVTPLRPWGLRSPLGLGARLQAPVVLGWCLGAVAAGFCMGIVSRVVTGDLPESFGDALSRFGLRGAVLDQFLALSFLFVGSVIALVPVSTIGAAVDDETTGRVVHLLSRPVTRGRLLAGHLLLGVVAVVASAVLAGVATWAGAAVQSVGLALGTCLAAALNVVPAALVVLGVGALVLAVRPRAAVPAVYTVVLGSLVAQTLGGVLGDAPWLERLSVLHWSAQVPVEDVQPLVVLAHLVAASALCGAAVLLHPKEG